MPEDVHCARCGRPFTEEERAGGISGKIMGDECADIYYWCTTCAVYTLRLYRDSFDGEETAHDSDPIDKQEGDRRLALIRSCPEPGDARCRCDGHRAYFGDSLD
jgi:hypothetical protein